MPAHRNAFGVVSAESRVLSVHALESIDDGLTGQLRVPADPFIDVGDCAEVDGQKCADRSPRFFVRLLRM
jgi:hypothetical protein